MIGASDGQINCINPPNLFHVVGRVMKFLDLRQIFQTLRVLLSAGLTLLLITACTSARPPQVELSFKVDPSGRPGVYLATGTTNLPDKSRITIAGIRYLTDKNLNRSTPANYSILARQTSEVAQGKWEATLNLWQVASDGRYQEAWQLNQPQLRFSTQPTEQVTFLATFEPDNQPAAVNQQLAKDGQEFNTALIRFTETGQRYLQISQTLAVGLPSGSTTPPVATDANGGWGDRSAPIQETAAPGRPNPPLQGSQSNAPLSPSEYAR
ncbi:MAG TPA: hypothetical protein V6D18_10990 [Thermosynechococcaceae cyanobacterium]|jgi:hypothetical protein